MSTGLLSWWTFLTCLWSRSREISAKEQEGIKQGSEALGEGRAEMPRLALVTGGRGRRKDSGEGERVRKQGLTCVLEVSLVTVAPPTMPLQIT